jgi:cytochrome c553
VVLAVALAGMLAACGGPEKQEAPQAGGNAAGIDLAAGKAIAERSCKGCHGLDGRSAAPGIPNLAGQSDRYLVASLLEYNNRKRMHAALKDLAANMSEADMRNVAAYYAELPAIVTAEAAKSAPPVMPYEAGKEKSKECAQCHGEDGNSRTPGVPTLAGQQPVYFVAAIQEYLRGLRKASPMHEMIKHLERADKENLALFYASQVPVERPSAPLGDPVAGEPLTAVCGGCHGSYGLSYDAATPTLAGQDAQYLVDAIKGYRLTRKNAVMQRQIAKLTDDEIANIAAFYTVQRSRPAEKGQRLVQDLAEKCDRCHAATAENPAMVVPKIHGQDRDYLVMALRAYRDDRRESSVMHKMSLPFGDTVIESIAALYASQSPK